LTLRLRRKFASAFVPIAVSQRIRTKCARHLVCILHISRSPGISCITSCINIYIYIYIYIYRYRFFIYVHTCYHPHHYFDSVFRVRLFSRLRTSLPLLYNAGGQGSTASDARPTGSGSNSVIHQSPRSQGCQTRKNKNNTYI